jgi:hypothetical protein
MLEVPIRISDPSEEAPAPRPNFVQREARYVTILLAGRLVNENGEDHLCRLRNISPGGCMLESRSPLRPGSPLRIELRSLHTIEGKVAWTRAPRSGIQFATQADVVELLHAASVKHAKARRARSPRITTECHVRVAHQGPACRAVLLDLSQSGAKLRTDDLLVNEQITLAVPEMPPRRAAVRWLRDGEAGLSFHDQIPFAELDQWLQDPALRYTARGAS